MSLQVRRHGVEFDTNLHILTRYMNAYHTIASCIHMFGEVKNPPIFVVVVEVKNQNISLANCKILFNTENKQIFLMATTTMPSTTALICHWKRFILNKGTIYNLIPLLFTRKFA